MSGNRYKTPLRYPGGKQKLAPFIGEIIQENDLVGCEYVEPYAGGAGVAIELLLDGTVSKIHLNDSCFAVYAFWKTILGDAEGFCRRIVRASLTVKEWRKQQAIFRDQQNQDIADVGFSLFFLNRVNRSGILSGGLIGGLAQRGDWLMDARFPRLELVRRVEAIAVKKDSIRLRNLDAERFIRTYVSKLPPSALVYCDPPYFEKADRLYLNHYLPDDHVRIAETIQRMRLPWVVSYDAAPAILECYKRRRQIQYGLQYNASKAYLGNEVFVFCDELRLPLSSRLGMLDQALREQSRRRPGQRARSPAAESRGCA